MVETPEEADYAYLHVWPCSNGMVFYQYAMPVIEMVDNGMFEAREANKSQKKTGEMVSITTLKDVTGDPVGFFTNCASLESITLPFVGNAPENPTKTYFGYLFGASSYSDNSTYVPSSLTIVTLTDEEESIFI